MIKKQYMVYCIDILSNRSYIGHICRTWFHVGRFNKTLDLIIFKAKENIVPGFVVDSMKNEK